MGAAGTARTGERRWPVRLPLRPIRLPPWSVDALLAAGLAAGVTIASLTSEEAGSRPSVAAAYAFGIALGGLALLRRRWPLAVLLLSLAVVVAYHSANFPAIGQSWPLLVAFYTCAAAGRLWSAVLVAAFTAAGSAVARLVWDAEPLLPVLASGLQEMAATGLALALGDAVRSRRGWAAEAQERLRRLERDRERETTRRIVSERMRIARELHDITAHTLAVAGVQLNVAADTLPDSPAQARAALGAAQQANREAVAELKVAVRVLREQADGELPRSPAPNLDEVDRLLAAAREAGLRVDYQVCGQVRPLLAPVGLAVYRVIQESITKVLRHARARTVQVQVDYQPEGVSVRVADDGRPAPGPPGETAGHGLIGMRERVVGLGGRFAAGRAESEGFVVTAWVPFAVGTWAPAEATA